MRRRVSRDGDSIEREAYGFGPPLWFRCHLLIYHGVSLTPLGFMLSYCLMNFRALRLSLLRSAYHREPLLASIGEVGAIWALGLGLDE